MFGNTPSYLGDSIESQIAGDGPQDLGAVHHDGLGGSHHHHSHHNTPSTHHNMGSAGPQSFQNPPQTTHSNFVRAVPIESPTQVLTYPDRMQESPYLLNYPYANSPQAYSGVGNYGGFFDDTLSFQPTPFKTALATSAFILLGAGLGFSIEKSLKKGISGYAKGSKLPEGYGAVIGALGANAVRLMGASFFSGGFVPASTALIGGLLPMAVPFALMQMESKPGNPATKYSLIGTGAALLTIPFILSRMGTKG